MLAKCTVTYLLIHMHTCYATCLQMEADPLFASKVQVAWTDVLSLCSALLLQVVPAMMSQVKLLTMMSRYS